MDPIEIYYMYNFNMVFYNIFWTLLQSYLLGLERSFSAVSVCMYDLGISRSKITTCAKIPRKLRIHDLWRLSPPNWTPRRASTNKLVSTHQQVRVEKETEQTKKTVYIIYILYIYMIYVIRTKATAALFHSEETQSSILSTLCSLWGATNIVEVEDHVAS